MKTFKKVLLAACVLSFGTIAQEKSVEEANSMSARPVPEGQIMKKLTLWRRIDLHEKKNQPMFALNSEITKHLIEGVRAGVIDAYSSDTCNKKLTLDQFNRNLKYTTGAGGLSKEEKEAGFGSTPAPTTAAEPVDDGWGGTTTTPAAGSKPAANDGWGGGGDFGASGGEIEFLPNELYLIELKENWVFDKQRSRQSFDIQTLTIMIPADKSPDGLEKPMASFKYKDLDRFFRSNSKCIWYNSENVAQHKNLADAFELRLFQGRIVKNSNPKDQYLDQIFKSQREGLLQSQRLEQELMEFEHNLWEY
jgi:Gliding motility associated protein GldN